MVFLHWNIRWLLCLTLFQMMLLFFPQIRATAQEPRDNQDKSPWLGTLEVRGNKGIKTFKVHEDYVIVSGGCSKSEAEEYKNRLKSMVSVRDRYFEQMKEQLRTQGHMLSEAIRAQKIKEIGVYDLETKPKQKLLQHIETGRVRVSSW